MSTSLFKPGANRPTIISADQTGKGITTKTPCKSNGGAAWESNPPRTGATPKKRFGRRGGQQTGCHYVVMSSLYRMRAGPGKAPKELTLPRFQTRARWKLFWTEEDRH